MHKYLIDVTDELTGGSYQHRNTTKATCDEYCGISERERERGREGGREGGREEGREKRERGREEERDCDRDRWIDRGSKCVCSQL